MVLGSGLAQLDGYPFEVRYSSGALDRAHAAAKIAADAYAYFGRLFGIQPDIALIVVGRADWESRQPYGLPFFNDDPSQIRPGILVMPAGSGDFWVGMGQDIRAASPRGYARLLAEYPGRSDGPDLQPFFDLITIHELGHAFAVLGSLKLPSFWLDEVFANLALHTFIAIRQPDSLHTLEVLSSVGAGSRRLAARWRADGYTTLEDLEAHYTGGDHPMNPLNYVWYQYRWQRLAAKMFDADGEAALTRFWDCFYRADLSPGEVTTSSLARLLTAEVSQPLGRAIQNWR